MTDKNTLFREASDLFKKAGELFSNASKLFSTQDDHLMPDWDDYYALVKEAEQKGLFRQEVTYSVFPITKKDKRFAKKRRVSKKEAS